MAAAVAAEVDLAVEAAASTAVVVAAPVLAVDTMVVITIILPITIIRITDPIGVVGTSVVGILDGIITVVADAWIFSYSPEFWLFSFWCAY